MLRSEGEAPIRLLLFCKKGTLFAKFMFACGPFARFVDLFLPRRDMGIKSRNGCFGAILSVLLVRATSCMWLPKTSGLICISHRPLLQEKFAKGQFCGKEGSCHLVCNNCPLFPRKINSKTCGDAREEGGGIALGGEGAVPYRLPPVLSPRCRYTSTHHLPSSQTAAAEGREFAKHF